MAQYDVFANPSSSAANGIPYVVTIQSDLLDGLATRLVIPLATKTFLGKVPAVLCPAITVLGQRLYALAHFAAPLPSKSLRKKVDNITAQASVLVAAMDAVLSGV